MKSGKAQAPKRAEVDTPAGWLPVDQALSWIAFRSLAPDWDIAFYFGASNWFSQTPYEALEHLRQIVAEPPGSLFRTTRYGPDFEDRVCTVAAALGLHGDDGPADPQTTSIDGVTAQLIDHLSAHLQDARAQHDRLKQAAEMLRLAIASDELAAYGWKGELPIPSDLIASIADARERIPAGACAGPVTVTGMGILPVANDEVRQVVVTPAWSGIMMRADDVVRLWPSTSTSLDSAGVEPRAADNPATDAERQQARRPQFNLVGLGLWHHNRVQRWPPDAAYPTELEDWQAAQREFEGQVPRSAIREIRKKFAPENWRKSGPRKRQ